MGAGSLVLADRVGTTEATKDADLVFWSGKPLVSASRAQYVIPANPVVL